MGQVNHQLSESPKRAQGKRVASIANRLGNYLDRGAPRGASGSNFGVMCERASLFEHPSVECAVCGGSGIREINAEEMKYRENTLMRETDPFKIAAIREQLCHDSRCRACRGAGWVPPRRNRKQFDRNAVTAKCWRCRGTGEVLDEDAEDVCPRCAGDAYTVPVTVFPTGSSKKGRMPAIGRGRGDDGKIISLAPFSAGRGVIGVGGPLATRAGDVLPEASEWFNEDAVREAGRMGRLEVELRKRSALHADVVAAYLGPTGNRWGQSRWGRTHAVWALTKPGRRLAEIEADTSHKGHTHLIPADELLASAREADARDSVPNLRRRVLLRQADEAARHLLTKAMGSLNAVAREVGL